MHRLYPILLLFSLSGAGCSEALKNLREQYRPTSPREAFAEGLEKAGIAGSSMARTWLHEGDLSVLQQVELQPPYQEVGYSDPAHPEAYGYRVFVERGQLLEVEGRFDDPGSTLFMDLFEPAGEPDTEPRHLSSADSTGRLVFESDRSGDYILRVQPELLATGRFHVEVQTKAALIFPVSGGRRWDIGSVFGAERDGGRRSHHGVDIFARRGTPVVAGRDGKITSTRIGGLGGKTVWLRGEDGRNYYYAHLDEQLVSSGDRVQAGDTLGLVGNTGNARTTPPHLHFGIYRNGPTDPWHFVVMPDTTLPSIRVDESVAGDWMRTRTGEAVLLSGAQSSAERSIVLDRHTSLRVQAVTGSYVRVRLPDGRSGYLRYADLEHPSAPIMELEVLAADEVRSLPATPSPSVDRLSPGSVLPVLGRFGDYLHVETPSGGLGWIRSVATG